MHAAIINSSDDIPINDVMIIVYNRRWWSWVLVVSNAFKYGSGKNILQTFFTSRDTTKRRKTERIHTIKKKSPTWRGTRLTKYMPETCRGINDEFIAVNTIATSLNKTVCWKSAKCYELSGGFINLASGNTRSVMFFRKSSWWYLTASHDGSSVRVILISKKIHFSRTTIYWKNCILW